MIFAVDVGGTYIKVGLVEDAEVQARTSIPAHSDRGLAQALPRIKAAGLELLSQIETSIDQCEAISISFPSIIDAKTSQVLFGYGKFMDAMELDLSEWAEKELNLPLVIDNDARVALMGEWVYGAGKGFDNLVMVTLGTGLGVAALIEGKILRGVHGQAAILGGHLSINPNGHLCHCGGRGCPEAEASTSVINERAREHPEFTISALSKLKSIDYTHVFDLAQRDDSVAIALKEQAIQAWATMMINLIHAYDPERLIVGGGIAAGWDQFMPQVIERVHRWNHTPWGKVELVPALLENDAALLGCDVLWKINSKTTNNDA
jgi:glucokinase